MKKMMFNDRYSLTEAVLQGRKTVTRRLIKPQKNINSAQIGNSALTPYSHIEIRGYHENGEYGSSFFKLPYKVGEIVAVAQKYSSFIKPSDWDAVDKLSHSKGWDNKMFVCADLMPHQIRILDVRAERLQDITDEDCLREGITYHSKINWSKPSEPYRCGKIKETTARRAFATLIDKISGKGTWERNPYVWRIEFELVK